MLRICYNDYGGNKMKKNNLWKAIGICFLAFIVLSWVIPTGSFSNGVLTKGDANPLGFMDIFKFPIITASTSLFVLNAIVILLIGGFYGVLNQTGVYALVVEKVVTKFKEKRSMFLVLSILIFGVLSSLTALTLPLFIMVPFFVAVILKLGYSKITAFLSTIGAILVGNMGSTYGFNVNGYISYFFNISMNQTIIARIIFFILATVLLILFVLFWCEKPKTAKSKKDEKVTQIPLYQHNVDKKKSATPMIILSIFMIILVLIGMYNWEVGLHVEFFNNIHSAITEFEIAGYPIFKNIIGTIDPIGYWSNYELAVILFLATLLIAWLYNLKGKQKWEAFVYGVKEMVPVALYTVAASILFLLMNSSSNGYTLFNTIANFFITLTKGFNVFTFGLLSVIGSIFYNDFPYILNSLYDPIHALYTNYGFIGMFTQMIHGFVMLIAPTSLLLVAGLKYLDISYTEWLKNIWKYLLVAFLLIVLVTIGLLLF